ncbi:MAG: STAS domain-containing protein [Candidatus Krumholzibacteria bacterium]|nr:STAS domain-containing protein [Candidatus Krumholzibacteria bacterium]MCK5620381.1 STAS domain-containing protein [Candidatus Krumholzibacteria bacterium]
MSDFSVDLVSCAVEGVAILRPVGSIDAAAAPILESYFKSLYEKNAKRIVIDFSKTDFISSAGIGIFLGSVSLMRESGGDILFMNVPTHIDEVFDLINLKSFFSVLENIDQIDKVIRS